MVKLKKGLSLTGETGNMVWVAVLIAFAAAFFVPKMSVAKDLFLPSTNPEEKEQKEPEVIENPEESHLEKGRKIIRSFKQELNHLQTRYRDEELIKYNVPCILGIFNAREIPDNYQVVIDVSREFEGDIDLDKIIDKFSESSDNEEADKIIQTYKRIHLSSFLTELNQISPSNNQLYLSQLSEKIGLKGTFEENLPEMVESLLVYPYFDLNKLLRYAESIPVNEEPLSNLAKNMGVTKFKFSEDPKHHIYYADEVGLMVYDSDEEIDRMEFIVGSGEHYDIIVPKIILTNDKIMTYDSDRVRIDASNNKINLILARHNGQNYWSTAEKKNPIKPYCYATISAPKEK